MHYNMGGNLTHKPISLQYMITSQNIYCKYAIEFSQIHLQYAINGILLYCNLFAISLYLLAHVWCTHRLICLQIVLTTFLWIESSPLLKIWMENPTSAIFNTYNILSKAGFTRYIVLLWKFLTYVVNSRHRTYYSNICSSCYIWFHDVLWLRPKYPILMQVCFFLKN